MDFVGHCWVLNVDLRLILDDSRLLAQHSRVWGKLQDEIAASVGVGQEAVFPDRNLLKKMKCLNLVIKEGI